jgi:hypothetical protein|tara:strand:+ start:1069 stop:1188 length:120 start_codon:yes stop_codon:yes gene_type:complete
VIIVEKLKKFFNLSLMLRKDVDTDSCIAALVAGILVNGT